MESMQTLHGVRFLPVARVAGTLFGLDARWLGVQGVGLIVVLTLAAPAGPLSGDGGLPLWLRACLGLATLAALVLTSLSHELGHVVAGRLAGLPVRAVVLAPGGAMTIREGSQRAVIDFRTALAGPLANAVLGMLCACAAAGVGPESPLRMLLTECVALQMLTAMANLLPWGRMDGHRILAAWRELQAF